MNVDRLGRSIHNYINYIWLERVTLEEYSNEWPPTQKVFNCGRSINKTINQIKILDREKSTTNRNDAKPKVISDRFGRYNDIIIIHKMYFQV